ncbi:hypothetical protein [Aurantiacibacter aquimixticola]|uniref:Lipoprotein n=1 Tax=Aurantiacibacter aquimixticola TaxID=1958945 RepID=A0A419RUX3_9SPHN|nr:hypothetical protein [Aurantiacibacter aquimixticola]RJY09586.1 hypothetical protein D6201_09640 [Aurantiacibacter aquimixticola]
MPRKPLLLIAPLLATALSGCVVRTAVDVVAAPVRVASKVVDWTTTSQDEADRARGREIRRREERLGELQRDLVRREDDCLEGDDRACRRAVATRREIEILLPTIPYERDD